MKWILVGPKNMPVGGSCERDNEPFGVKIW